MRYFQKIRKVIVKTSFYFLMIFTSLSYADKNESSLKSEYRVFPYVQNPTPTGITLKWFSHKNKTAMITLYDKQKMVISKWKSSPRLASELAYSKLEPFLEKEHKNAIPFSHEIHIHDLTVDQRYHYEVIQNGELAKGEFKTAASKTTPIRFIVYSDSETEPESTGKHANWPSPQAADKKRKYLVDQTTGYRENLQVIAQRKPDFIAIAGDLVQSGGEQRDWDEFWRHNRLLSSSVPIMPALGNHEYYAGPGDFGAWQVEASERSVSKFKSYFDLPKNNARNEVHNERYYAFDYGPLTLITLDPGNGEKNKTSQDTNWSLLGSGEGGFSPSWSKGSQQYQWLEEKLKEAQQKSQFTFVMFHHCPYTSGVHGLKPGVDGDTANNTSALPLRDLTPLFMKYGVDVLLNGHGEMAEHSLVSGKTFSMAKNKTVPHNLHVYDVGIGGDGLRGPHPTVVNPHKIFLAHENAPEVFSKEGILLDGGKHYGHLEVNLFKDASKKWYAELDFVYVFPVMDSNGKITRFERRLYPDKTRIVSKRKIY